MSFESGRVLCERYRLIRPLGQGSQASVWIAEHLALSTQVAVKLIDPELAKKEDARERFRREATAAAQLRSAHVVQILDHGIDDEQPFIIMELLDGEDLFERLRKRKRLTLQETSRVITQVCRALARAHTAGIVHRDLKPENFFIVHNEDDEVVKVLDFGVAKVSDPKKIMQRTSVGTLVGTPHYMSPEQVKGIGEVDYRTDLWALGVIAYECVTGELPFDSEGVGDLLIKISIGDVPVPSRVKPDIPPAFDAWFARACDRDPARRFASARDLADSLARVAGLSTEIGSSAEAAAPRPPAALPRPTPTHPPPPSGRGKTARGTQPAAKVDVKADDRRPSAPPSAPKPVHVPPAPTSAPRLAKAGDSVPPPSAPRPPPPRKPVTPKAEATPPAAPAAPAAEPAAARVATAQDEAAAGAKARAARGTLELDAGELEEIKEVPADSAGLELDEDLEPEPEQPAAPAARPSTPADEARESQDIPIEVTSAREPSVRPPPRPPQPAAPAPQPRVIAPVVSGPVPVPTAVQPPPQPAQASPPSHPTVSGLATFTPPPELDAGGKRRRMMRYFVVGLLALTGVVVWKVIDSQIPPERTVVAPPEPERTAQPEPFPAPTPTPTPQAATSASATVTAVDPGGSTGVAPLPKTPKTATPRPKGPVKKKDDMTFEIPTPPPDDSLPPPAP